MSGLQTKKAAIESVGSTEAEELKNKLMCASDRQADFTWQEIDGVRRVIEIVFTSAALDAEEGMTIVLTRTFVYEGTQPFDLDKITNVLTVT